MRARWRSAAPAPQPGVRGGEGGLSSARPAPIGRAPARRPAGAPGRRTAHGPLLPRHERETWRERRGRFQGGGCLCYITTVPIETGKRYLAQVWVRKPVAREGTAVALEIRWNDAAGRWYNGAANLRLDARKAGVWEQLQIPFMAPPGRRARRHPPHRLQDQRRRTWSASTTPSSAKPESDSLSEGPALAAIPWMKGTDGPEWSHPGGEAMPRVAVHPALLVSKALPGWVDLHSQVTWAAGDGRSPERALPGSSAELRLRAPGYSPASGSGWARHARRGCAPSGGTVRRSAVAPPSLAPAMSQRVGKEPGEEERSRRSGRLPRVPAGGGRAPPVGERGSGTAAEWAASAMEAAPIC